MRRRTLYKHPMTILQSTRHSINPDVKIENMFSDMESKRTSHLSSFKDYSLHRKCRPPLFCNPRACIHHCRACICKTKFLLKGVRIPTPSLSNGSAVASAPVIKINSHKPRSLPKPPKFFENTKKLTTQSKVCCENRWTKQTGNNSSICTCCLDFF